MNYISIEINSIWMHFVVKFPRSGSVIGSNSRNCVSYIVSSVLGRVLREKAQLSACKDLVKILHKSINTGDKEEGQEAGHSQHLQVNIIIY